MTLISKHWKSYHGDSTARPDALSHSHHAHVVSILAPPHEVLVSHVVGAVVDHEAAALNPAGVAPAQVRGQFRAVTAGLIVTTLEVPVLVEDDLKRQKWFIRTIFNELTNDCLMSITKLKLNKFLYLVPTFPMVMVILVVSQDWVVTAVYSWWWLLVLYLLNVKKACTASIVQNPDPATTCHRSLLSSQGIKGLLFSTIQSGGNACIVYMQHCCPT